MRQTSASGVVLGVVWALVACGSDPSGASGAGPAAGEPLTADVVGSAQKGPFSAGSRVTIAELDANLVQTGRTFNTTMNDDGGSYSIRGVQLGTPYARVEVDGFYFDEVRGQLSASPLSIFSYVDLSNAATSNINLLGHLEAARLEQLVTEENVGFAAAKDQAHGEVLRMFEIEPGAIDSAEALDISQGGDGNAALFAISIMLQGTRTVAELSELLSNIQNDLRRDGTLDDAANGSALMGGATTVDIARARQNLVERFAAVGVDAAVPDIEGQITRFADSAPYTYTGGGGIEYPIGGERPNLLDLGMTRFDFNPAYTQLGFVADVPDATELTIRITNHSDNASLSGPSNVWFYSGSSVVTWTVTNYDFETGIQEFSANRPGVADMQGFMFGGSGSATVEYFEYGSETPTRTKEVTWSGWDGVGAGTGTGAPSSAAPRGSGAAGGAGGAGAGGDGAGGSSGYPQPPRTDPAQLCGNGTIDEASEDCDGAELGGATCASVRPETTGELRCRPDVCRLDMDDCERPCGNGVIDAGEECDTSVPTSGCMHCNPECRLEELC